MATVATTAPLLHRFLGIGQVLLAAVAVFFNYRGGIAKDGDSVMLPVAYVLVGVCAVLVAVALLILKPRVPIRPLEQPVDAYWGTPSTVAQMFRVSFRLVGAGVLTTVAYL